jgi:hypothetical protein
MASVLNLVDYDNPKSLGSRLRRRRQKQLREVIRDIAAKKGSVKILDVGGRPPYWRLLDYDNFLRDNNVHVTLLNYSADEFATGIEHEFPCEVGDACDVSGHGNNAFDLVHSNSTIEHVGDWPRMEAFASEVRRLAPSYFIQTPYYWFPVEPHFLMPFFHWLPSGLRAKMLVANMVPHKGKSPDIGDAMLQVQGARLLDRAQMLHLFPDAQLRFEWLGPFPKSLIATRRD